MSPPSANAGNLGSNPRQKMTSGTPLPTPPRAKDFPTIDVHRAHIKSHMCAAFRSFAARGFNEGMSAHISVRDPENPNTYLTNPLGRHFAMTRPSDLVLVNEHGEPVDGNNEKPVNAAGYFIHSAVHRARPDVRPRAICIRLTAKYGAR